MYMCLIFLARKVWQFSGRATRVNTNDRPGDSGLLVKLAPGVHIHVDLCLTSSTFRLQRFVWKWSFLISYPHALHSNTITCSKESRNSKAELVAYLTFCAENKHPMPSALLQKKNTLWPEHWPVASDPSISVLQHLKVRGAYVSSEAGLDAIRDGGRVQNVELVMLSSAVWSSLRGTHLSSVCHCPGCPLTLSAVL